MIKRLVSWLKWSNPKWYHFDRKYWIGGTHILWYGWSDDKDRFISIEVCGPAWRFPQIHREEKYTRVGWLIFAIAAGWENRRDGKSNSTIREGSKQQDNTSGSNEGSAKSSSSNSN